MYTKTKTYFNSLRFSTGSSIDKIDANYHANGIATPPNATDTDMDHGGPVVAGREPMQNVDPANTGDNGYDCNVHPRPLDTTYPKNIGSDFEFGKVDGAKGILKKPPSHLLNGIFGSNSPYNPFVQKYNGNNSTEQRNSNEGEGFGSMKPNQHSTVADSFAQKLKQGAEETVK
ncbi:hypothetical protein Tco_0611633 [Tanacetum coccineum]